MYMMRLIWYKVRSRFQLTIFHLFMWVWTELRVGLYTVKPDRQLYCVNPFCRKIFSQATDMLYFSLLVLLIANIINVTAIPAEQAWSPTPTQSANPTLQCMVVYSNCSPCCECQYSENEEKWNMVCEMDKDPKSKCRKGIVDICKTKCNCSWRNILKEYSTRLTLFGTGMNGHNSVSKYG